MAAKDNNRDQLKDYIESALQGDLEAFNHLVLEFQDLVYYQAYRIMGERGAAEDAVQEAFLSAYRKLTTYRGGSFKSWLLRIVSNECYDELRRRKRQPVVPLTPRDDHGEEFDSPSWMEDPEEKPEQFLSRKDLSIAIQRCLDQLDSNFRTVVVLVDLQEMDYASAAEITEVPLGTIKSRLARARQSMQECLSEFGELLPVDLRHEGEAEQI